MSAKAEPTSSRLTTPSNVHRVKTKLNARGTENTGELSRLTEKKLQAQEAAGHRRIAQQGLERRIHGMIVETIGEMINETIDETIDVLRSAATTAVHLIAGKIARDMILATAARVTGGPTRHHPQAHLHHALHHRHRHHADLWRCSLPAEHIFDPQPLL